jgi:hypothetical protein
MATLASASAFAPQWVSGDTLLAPGALIAASIAQHECSPLAVAGQRRWRP